MASPLDRLEDGFPHGTIEGERAGCLGSDCPASPITCAEVGASYRRDAKFKRLYKSGLRGAELADAMRADAPAPAPVPDPPAEVSGTRRDVWDSLTQEQRDVELIEMFEVEELSFAQIGVEIGKPHAGPVARMVKAACDRRDAAAGVPAAEPEPPAVEPTPPAPTVEVELLDGPRMARQQMWVVLDQEGNVLFASPDPATATESLAAAWRVRLAEINQKEKAA